MKVHSNYLFNEAQKKIKYAEEELMRPAEDVVTISICKNSKIAIRYLLESYLLQHDIPVKEDDSMANLLDKCIALNENFKKINLSQIDCKNHRDDKNYCMDVDKVSGCLDVAKQIETLLGI